MGKQTISKNYETIIIGGGVVGAGVFRELTLRGEKTLLLEKGDFSSQTSQSSSKMLHGGIRYLENFDFLLVREALKEKNLWTRIAPRLTKARMFYIPVYKESKWPLFFVSIGLFIYDLLSGFKNPKRKTLNAKQALQALPGLKSKNLRGAGVYSDAIVEDSKLALECVYDGLGEYGSALNYHEVVSLKREGKRYTVRAQNLLTQAPTTFTCENIVVAAGPFTDQLLKQLNIEWSPKMILSKGSHIWLKEEALSLAHPMVLQTKDNRVIFVIPQRGAILVGTTEKALDADANIFNIQASPEEVDYLIDAVNQYFPDAKVNHSHILATFAGVRPLVAEKGKERGKVSRSHKIFTPQPHMYVVIGGKYTTFRVMAEDVVKRMRQDSKKPFKRGLSARPLRRPSLFGMDAPKSPGLEDLRKIAQEELAKTPEDITKRRLSILGQPQENVSIDDVKKALQESAQKDKENDLA